MTDREKKYLPFELLIKELANHISRKINTQAPKINKEHDNITPYPCQYVLEQLIKDMQEAV